MKNFKNFVNSLQENKGTKPKNNNPVIEMILDVTDIDDNIFKKYRIKHKVINASGPGGGWPEVKLTGKREDIKKWFLKYYSDQNDWEFFLSDSKIVR